VRSVYDCVTDLGIDEIVFADTSGVVVPAE
jgi:hypothetical protein